MLLFTMSICGSGLYLYASQSRLDALVGRSHGVNIQVGAVEQRIRALNDDINAKQVEAQAIEGQAKKTKLRLALNEVETQELKNRRDLITMDRQAKETISVSERFEREKLVFEAMILKEFKEVRRSSVALYLMTATNAFSRGNSLKKWSMFFLQKKQKRDFIENFELDLQEMVWDEDLARKELLLGEVSGRVAQRQIELAALQEEYMAGQRTLVDLEAKLYD